MSARSGIACAGNWILDIVHDIPVWPRRSDLVRIAAEHIGLGGGAANVAADLTALGVPYPVTPIGAIGDDIHGEDVLRMCAERGLSRQALTVLPGVPTARTHVMNVPGDSRTFFYRPGANDVFGPEHVDLAALGARIFYLGYLNLLPGFDRIGPDGTTQAAALLAAARTMGMLTVVDLVSTEGPHYADVVRGTLAAIDVLILNEVEAERATGLMIAGPADAAGLERAARALAEGGIRRAVVLHTPEFALWLEGGDIVVETVPRVDPSAIVSFVGAGDAFAAGVLHGLHEGFAASDCMRLGIAVARCSLGGATATDGIPTLEELREVLPVTPEEDRQVAV